jgi:hypothetical protein
MCGVNIDDRKGPENYQTTFLHIFSAVFRIHYILKGRDHEIEFKYVLKKVKN